MKREKLEEAFKIMREMEECKQAVDTISAFIGYCDHENFDEAIKVCTLGSWCFDIEQRVENRHLLLIALKPILEMRLKERQDAVEELEKKFEEL